MSTVPQFLKRQGRRVVLILTLVALLVVPLATPPGAAAQGGNISGTVTDPDGNPPPADTVVRLLRPNRTTFGQVNVDVDGSFNLAGVPSGSYILRAVPPESSALTPSQPVPVFMLPGSAVNVGDVALTHPSILGDVYAPDGTTKPSAWVMIHSASVWLETTPATGGNIKIGGLPAGSYVLQAWPMHDDPYWASAPLTVSVTPGISHTVSLTLTHAHVVGTVQDSSGNAVQHAIARIVDANTGRVVQRDLTSATGYFAIGGLAAGSYALTLVPPWWQAALIPPAPVPFTVPPRQDLGIIQFQSSRKIVTGTIETNTGQHVVGALIDVHRLDKAGQAQTHSRAGGVYNISLSEGLWSLTVKPISITTPLRWIYPYGPQLVHFKHDISNETKTVNFKVLTADSNVTGTVEMPGGGVPPFTVTVRIHTDAGIGHSQQISPTTGAFDIAVPHGRYKVAILPDDPGYMGPAVDPIHVPPGSTYPLGTLVLLERNATITGLVTDSDPVSDIPVIAWRPDAPGGAHTRSGTDGDFVLSVVEGTWLVKPAPGPDQPWLYAGRPTEVEVTDAGTVTDVDFLLTATDAEIVGTLVDESGTIVADVEGWVHAVNTADPSIQKGASVEDGVFTVLVPAGTYNVGLRLPAGAEYIAPLAKDVSVSSGGSATVTFELREKNSKIAGALWDRRDEVVVTGVDATVTAFSEGAWLRTTVHPGNGAYTMSVASGIWTLGYRVDPTSNYVALRHRRNYPVEDYQTIPVPLPVAEKDGLISGTVRDPDGTGLGGAMVIADGVGQGLGDVTLRTLSRPDGTFELAVPHGHYVLRATLGADSSWINPVSLRIYVPPDGSVSGRELQFLEPDATISGVVDIGGTHSYSGTVHLWAWSPGDGYTKATTSLGGDYTMNVISNTTWHVGAAFQTASQYWVAYARVPVPEGGATQDLTLRGPFSLPAPVTVSFDASEEQYVELADGTSIYIPAGAMPVSGMVTLHVTPIATFPHQRHANVYRYGYAFTATDDNGQPIEQRFNQDVLITFSYNEAELLRMGISELWLKPAYFSTTTDSWTFPEGYVVDTVANVVAMQIDHFTGFALTGEAGQQVFLPLVLR